MIEITHDPLDPEAVTAGVRRDTNGAVVTFLGTTRGLTGGREVLHLEYEAYRPMADNTLARSSMRYSRGGTSRTSRSTTGWAAWEIGEISSWSRSRRPTVASRSRPASTASTASSRSCLSGRRSSSKMARCGSGATAPRPPSPARVHTDS